MLEMLRTEFKGELAGLKADLTNYPQCLINFLIKEAGEDLNAAISFLDLTSDQISQYKEDDPDKKTDNRDADKDANALPPDKEGEQIEASKTQGTVPRAPEATPAEGTTASTINTMEGDKEGLQSMSRITPDVPPWLLQAERGEHHTLQQPVPPAPPNNGEQQNKQPLVGRVKNCYNPTNQGSH